MFPLVITFGLISYIYGSIPFALVFTYLITKKNLLNEGTGNVGVINSFRTGGTYAGLLTVIAEISKAFVPIGFSYFLLDYELWISLTFLFLTLLGTNFSIFLRFKGGHGTTMTFYSTLVLSPFSSLTLLSINALFHVFSRYDFRIKRLWNLFLPAVIYLFESLDLPFERGFRDDIIYTSFAAATAVLFLLRSGESRDDYVRHFEEYEMSKRKHISIRFNKLSSNKKVPFVGNKASNIEFLLAQRMKVPTTYALDWYMCSSLLEGEQEIQNKIMAKIEKTLSPSKYYAIRSSSYVEDNPEFSFAGQFKSILNVKGFDNILKGVEEVYNSRETASVKQYFSKAEIQIDELKMGVIIQEMVHPVVSGVSFGKNPITGLDEVVIEAVEGSGELLHQDGITPFSWVYRWGEVISDSEIDSMPQDIIEHIAKETIRIQKKYKKPVDLEWVYDGKELFWVQIRPITTFTGLNIYSNKFSKEFLPGIIKPLIFSINIPLINTTWIDVLTELIGNNDLDPYDLAQSFYYRAYFNLGKLGDIFEAVGFPRELLEILIFSEQEDKKPKVKITLKTLRHLPRLIKFIISKLFLFERKIKYDLEILINEYDKFDKEHVIDKDPKEILESINKLFILNKQVVYFNIMIPLLNLFFNNRLFRRLKKYNYTLEILNNQLKYQQDLSDFEPNTHIERLSKEFRKLSEDKQKEIRNSSYSDFLKIPDIIDFKTNVNDLIERFGHLSDSGNDFSTLTWKDEPKRVLDMITTTNNTKVKTEVVDYFPLRKIRMRSLLGKVKRYRYYKEKISFNYSFGYNLFRKYFSVLAKLFVNKGIIQSEDDIYYLKFDEIADIIEKELWQSDKKEQISIIKSEIQQYYDITVPATIYGETIPPIIQETKVYNKFVGKPSSAGYYMGKVRKIKGIKEFGEVNEGDVLVIPYSDVAWTPIILKAGAVLSESGGMLSHCSIVAREYNIPAVVSVEGILSLNNGDIVTVDGYKGVIYLVERISKDS